MARDKLRNDSDGRLPRNEAQRLAALRACDIVGTPREPFFDRLTSMAVSTFDVEMALISLVEKDRQWFKSTVGLDVNETPRTVSFCAHVILHDHAMVVPDAKQDERFVGNPLVTGAPDIRFYAGAPLITFDGFRLGAFRVIDSRPRPDGLTQRQVGILTDLAAVAMHEIERGR